VPIIKAAARLQGQISSCASSISQHAGIAALRTHDELMGKHVAELRAKRDLGLELLRAIPGVTVPTPEGAFYLLPDVSAYFGRTAADGTLVDSAEALCIHLLKSHKVALVPGEAFGAPNTIRLSYAATMDEIRDAIGKLGECVRAL
jgi:aspartate/methionine/tyrosine aminotransferase